MGLPDIDDSGDLPAAACATTVTALLTGLRQAHHDAARTVARPDERSDRWRRVDDRVGGELRRLALDRGLSIDRRTVAADDG